MRTSSRKVLGSTPDRSVPDRSTSSPKMNPHFWLSVALLMSRIGLIETAGQCRMGDNSVNGMFLKGHTFKTIQAGNPAIRMMRCEEEVRCQSYNFVIGRNICELNDRTKEARPEDFIPDDQRIYMRRTFNRGDNYKNCMLLDHVVSVPWLDRNILSLTLSLS